MRSAQAIVLLLAILAQTWLALPLRATDAGAAVPSTCRCCPCGGSTCCAAPDRAVPNPTPVPAAPTRSALASDLLLPPAPATRSGFLPLPVAPPVLTPGPPHATAAAPIFLRGCALLI